MFGWQEQTSAVHACDFGHAPLRNDGGEVPSANAWHWQAPICTTCQVQVLEQVAPYRNKGMKLALIRAGQALGHHIQRDPDGKILPPYVRDLTRRRAATGIKPKRLPCLAKLVDAIRSWRRLFID